MNKQAQEKTLRLIAGAAFLSAVAVRPVYAQSQTPPVAWKSSFTTNVYASSWEYETLAELWDDHTIPPYGWSSPFAKHKPITRYEAAVAIARAVDINESIVRKEKDIPAFFRRMVPRMDQTVLKDIPLLSKLASAFSDELKYLGMDVPLSQRRLDVLEQALRSMQPPFPDVAPTHWASASVERLRVSGVLVGYPDATFLSKQK